MIRKPVSINNRIIALTVITVSAMALLFGSLSLVITRITLESHVNTKSGHIIIKLEKILSVPVINQDFVQIINIIDEETKSSDLKYTWLLNKDGIVTACNDENQLMAPINPEFTQTEGFICRSLNSGEKICILPDYSIINTITMQLLPWILLAIIIAAAGVQKLSIKMIRKVTLPILNAVEASASMAKGNFSITLPESDILEINGLNLSLTSTAQDLKELTARLEQEKDDLSRSREEIRELSEFRESIIDNASIWLNVLDKDSRIVVWNKAAEEISGYSRDEVLMSGNVWTLLYPDEDYRESITGKASSIIYRNESVSDMITVIRTKSGEEKTISWYSKNLTTLTGEPTGSIAMGIDITEKIKAEETLQQAQKMETVGILAGGIAHDFNNVLIGIVGTLSLLEYKLNKDENLPRESMFQYINTIQNSADRARDLVNQLLTLSRKQKLELKSIDLNTAVHHVLEICRGSFDKSIVIIPPEEGIPAYVNADLSQIEQVILNFCVNASHAMTIMKQPEEKWGGTLSITLEISENIKEPLPAEKPSGKFWQLSVRDTGIGMSRTVMRRIFDPFFTTKDKGTGTGLGLSMAYNILKAHGGYINVYSEPGEGSIFNIYLPVLETGVTDSAVPASDDIRYGTGLILVADDESANRDIARMMLEDCGYSVITADNGVEAIRIFSEKQDEIDLSIIDIVMPQMSGDETCREILKISPGAKIIISSGFRDDMRVKKAMKDGAKLFVPKPYTLIALSEAVDRVLKMDSPEKILPE